MFEYACLFRNCIQDHYNLFHLTGKPKCEIVGKKHRTFVIGQTATLQGKVKSYPKLNALQWHRLMVAKTKQLNLNRKKYEGSSNDHHKPTLVINNIDTSDCGYYILRVENVKSMAESESITIDIIGGKLKISKI